MTKAWNEFALAFDSIDKIVVSRSLESAGDRTRIVRQNPRDEIVKLKREQGKNILIGGVSIPSQFMELGLVDEYRFVVSPVEVGEGRRLLGRCSSAADLKASRIEDLSIASLPEKGMNAIAEKS